MKNNQPHQSQLTRRRCFALAGLIAISLSVQPALGQEEKAEEKNRATIKYNMTIDLLDRVAVSASVDGVIKSIAGRTGSPTTKDQPLIELETDRRAKELEATLSDYRALKVRAENDSREKSGRAREYSARVNLKKLREVKTRYQVNVPTLELVRAESQLREAASDRIGAKQELSQFKFEAEAKLREAELLGFDLRKSTINSQFDGTISQVEKHAGEFVQAGETIVELYRMDRLSGVVLINRKQLLPEKAIGVTGELVIKNNGESRSYEITIVRTLPRVDVDGKYRAFVELDNEKHESGNWRLLPGMTGRVTFEVEQENKPKKKPNKDRMTLRHVSQGRVLANAGSALLRDLD